MYISWSKKHVDLRSYKTKNVLLAVISSYIGPPSNYVGHPRNPRTVYYICPFHTEKNASLRPFKAPDNTWKYKCFGCGRSGDVFRFVSTMERGCCFPKAIRLVIRLSLSSTELRRSYVREYLANNDPLQLGLFSKKHEVPKCKTKEEPTDDLPF